MEYFGIKFILACFALVILVHAQDQSGFISLDCGLKKDTNYTEEATGIYYISDVDYVESGQSFTLNNQSHDGYEKQMWTLRSFPDGTRNCYSLNLTRGGRYLISATFLYGNYDDKNEAPEFDVYLGPNLWVTVKMEDSSSFKSLEIIHVLASDYLDVCLVNTDNGTPFISSLEFRHMAAYIDANEIGSLQYYTRLDVGSNDSIGRKYDVYNRYWYSYMNTDSDQQITVSDDSLKWKYEDDFATPLTAMRTAETPKDDTSPWTFWWTDHTINAKYYVYYHFAELEILQANETRKFTINFNNDSWQRDQEPIQPSYLYTDTVHSTTGVTSTDGNFTIQISKTGTSTHPPILNAMEIYRVIQFPQSQTDITDIDAIKNIKAAYSLKGNWQGDPCAPQIYMWDGLNCSYLDDDPPRITSLNLSSSGLEGEIPNYISNLTSLQVLNLSSTGLTGEIARYISNLTMLEVLDLSNNSLTGSYPDFLAHLSSLNVLNLKGNNFTGSVPEKLIERSKDGKLTLSIDETNGTCVSTSCSKKSSSVLVSVVASVASAFVLVILVVAIFLVFKKKKQQQGGKVVVNKQSKSNPSLDTKNRRFTYEEIINISNNFETVIGEGGFGKVYLGYLDNKELAIKVLSVSSRQGYTQFQAEVNLLMRVHHRHLTTLVGYCDEDNKIGLVYEFMANGDLSNHLSERSTDILSWEERLKIAVEAAQGLEYLHDGCKPPIVHRDIKTANILLNDRFQAKIADFGLSKSFPVEGSTHVSHLSTIVAGTPGYLDPEYYVTGRLTEKSDIFSFGVVLLEIITSRPVITNMKENNHISQWVNYMISSGNIKGIVDQRLFGDFDTNSAWKCLEVAMACVSASPTRRPTMSQVVTELKECFAMEISRRSEINGTSESLQESSDMFTVIMDTELTPLAR